MEQNREPSKNHLHIWSTSIGQWSQNISEMSPQPIKKAIIKKT